MNWRRGKLVVLIALAACIPAVAQETVFNVPSGDILDRGKLYGELDFTYPPATRIASFAPRLVMGAGHRIEVGVNVSGLVTGGTSQATLAPTFKCKPYDGGRNGWAFLVGDDVFIPLQDRSYDAGNYLYAEGVKVWRANTRLTFGAYYFTPNVVTSAQRAGGQFAAEQPAGKRLTLAADWYTGHHALGYFTPGFVLKLTSKTTLYGAYQIGNSGVTNGNHQLLIEFGWAIN